MKSFFLICVSVLMTTTNLISQDVYDKIAKNICKCIEKAEAESEKDIQVCFEQGIFENLDDILKHHDVKTVADLDGTEMGERIGGRLAMTCPYLATIDPPGDVPDNQIFEADTLVSCAEDHTGDYYYLDYSFYGEGLDTTFVTFTETEYLERMKGGRTYSKLSLDWNSDCAYTMTFMESNDPLKSSLSKVGDKWEYEIIRNSDQALVIKQVWEGKEFHIEYFKLSP